jgi:hypothetical protein
MLLRKPIAVHVIRGLEETKVEEYPDHFVSGGLPTPGALLELSDSPTSLAAGGKRL